MRGRKRFQWGNDEARGKIDKMRLHTASSLRSLNSKAWQIMSICIEERHFGIGVSEQGKLEWECQSKSGPNFGWDLMSENLPKVSGYHFLFILPGLCIINCGRVCWVFSLYRHGRTNQKAHVCVMQNVGPDIRTFLTLRCIEDSVVTVRS